MTEQPDLAALFARITQRLLAAERPLLAEHGLSMWAYIVLCQLSASTAGSQLSLARRIGYDKTRLIKLLDELTDAGLVERRPDPTDRRAHLVAITAAGRARVDAARTDIRAMEDEVLSELTTPQQRSLRGMLVRLDRPARQDETRAGARDTASPLI